MRTSPEALYSELTALRDAADPTDPAHDARWRRVAAWLEATFGGSDAEDARQETLITLLRCVGEMQAEAPRQAVKWIGTIHRRKRIDALRARRRDPLQQALADEPPQRDAPPLLERVEAAEQRRLTPAMLERVLQAALDATHRELEETVKSPRKRLLRRTQAEAALLRLVCGWEADAITAALDYGEPIGKDRLYKWVERGRAPAKAGLARWAREDPEVGEVVEALADLLDERRGDAGRPRPARRKAPEGGA